MTIRTAIAPALLMLAAVLALSACGNKGPLVLPEENTAETVDGGSFEDEAPPATDESLDEADVPPTDAAGDGPPGNDGR